MREVDQIVNEIMNSNISGETKYKVKEFYNTIGSKINDVKDDIYEEAFRASMEVNGERTISIKALEKIIDRI